MSVKYKLEMILASLIDESPVVNICAIFDNINRLKHTVYYMHHLLKNSENSTFCLRSVFVFLTILTKKRRIFPNIINPIGLCKDMNCILCEAGLKFCEIEIPINFSVQNANKVVFFRTKISLTRQEKLVDLSV